MICHHVTLSGDEADVVCPLGNVVEVLLGYDVILWGLVGRKRLNQRLMVSERHYVAAGYVVVKMLKSLLEGVCLSSICGPFLFVCRQMPAPVAQRPPDVSGELL